MKCNFTKFTKGILDIMFVAGILVILTLPYSLKWYGDFVDTQLNNYLWHMVIIFAVCGILALMIVWELRKMFKTVLMEDCFVKENVTSLRRMGTYAFVISFVMTIRCFMFYITLAAVAMIIVFIIAGLFSKVLSQVFDKAVAYKLENDFTI